ncbi:hypothetical protein [Streptomyces sp. MMG1121]|uniref:hypothetical protein n=1 Tax=Streptomyces sp. MMG1121 TaxID=1415544 RepID=UPI0006ADAC27|nr:hypothetical protein [Streptomyces sp. MMG1121]KOV70755.1 hypothetical protein ADK64_02705 [Streptomyces sp. MMG1121]
MRSIALRTKTALTALAGAGVLTLGIATAAPANGVERDLTHLAARLPGEQVKSGPVLADERDPRNVTP